MCFRRLLLKSDVSIDVLLNVRNFCLLVDEHHACVVLAELELESVTIKLDHAGPLLGYPSCDAVVVLNLA